MSKHVLSRISEYFYFLFIIGIARKAGDSNASELMIEYIAMILTGIQFHLRPNSQQWIKGGGGERFTTKPHKKYSAQFV